MLSRDEIDESRIIGATTRPEMFTYELELVQTAQQLAEWLESAIHLGCRGEADCPYYVGEHKDGKFTLCSMLEDQTCPADDAETATRAWLQGQEGGGK